MEQRTSSPVNAADFIKAVHGIRYQATEVARAVAFYTQHLGFKLKHQAIDLCACVAALKHAGVTVRNDQIVRGCQPAAPVAVRETGLMWANMLRAFQRTCTRCTAAVMPRGRS